MANVGYSTSKRQPTQLTIERLREVVESIQFQNTVIIGVQPRGVLLAEKSINVLPH